MIRHGHRILVGLIVAVAWAPPSASAHDVAHDVAPAEAPPPGVALPAPVPVEAPPPAPSVAEPVPVAAPVATDPPVAPVAPAPPAPLVQEQTAAQAADTTQVARADVAPDPAVAAPAQAVDVATVQQSIWQAQIGCLSDCVDSTQVQVAVQDAAIDQQALATGAPATAAAIAGVLQEILQVQVGCLSRCRDATQVQNASQTASVAQSADATRATAPRDAPDVAADLSSALWAALRDSVAVTATATAADGATITQVVRQLQLGCRVDCADVALAQASSQTATTAQSATAPDPDDPIFGTFQAIAGWIDGLQAGTATALNVHDTAQQIRQAQLSACRTHCSGLLQLQAAIQLARTVQLAATGRRPPIAAAPAPASPPDLAAEPDGAPPSAAALAPPPRLPRYLSYVPASCHATWQRTLRSRWRSVNDRGFAGLLGCWAARPVRRLDRCHASWLA